MKNYKIAICVVLIIVSYKPDFAQDDPIGKKFSDDFFPVKKELLYNIISILDKDGNVTRGFLVGLKSDSIVILKNEKTISVSFDNLAAVTVDIERGVWKGFIIGSILGIYAGQLAFFQAESQPMAYWNNEDAGWKALASSLFVLVGGGIGYIIDAGSQHETETFIITGSEQINKTEIERLKNLLHGNGNEKKIHLNIQLSQVNTRLSEVNREHSYSNNHTSSFNLLRKLQLTYSISNEIEVGGAINWFGEPIIDYFFPAIRQSFEGSGYYAILNYLPLKSVFGSAASWVIGGGTGFGNINYEFYCELYSNEVLGTREKKINKSLFSWLIYSQFNFNLYDELSLGLVADYIYLPGEMEAIPDFGLAKRKLGNFSFGAAIGLHF